MHSPPSTQQSYTQTRWHAQPSINTTILYTDKVTCTALRKHNNPIHRKQNSNSVAFSPQMNYTNRAAAACHVKLVPTFADRRCYVVSPLDSYSRSLTFLDQNRYSSFQATPQLYSRGWMDPVPDPLLFRKSGSARNQTRDLWICSQELWPLDHRGGCMILYIRHEKQSIT
jgi:hypothetical protein